MTGDDRATEQPAEVSRRRMLIGLGVTVGLLVVVFGVVLPQFINYDEVIDAFLSLEPWQPLLLLAITVGAWLLSGVQLRSTLPGLAVLDATQTMVASQAVQGTIPGPVDAALRFRIAVAFGRTAEDASISVAMMKLYEVTTRLLMPAAAVVILAVAGRTDFGWVAVLAVAFSAGSITFLMAIVRSERLTRTVGGFVERTLAGVAHRFGQTPPTDLSGKLLEVRDNAQTLASVAGLFGLAITLLIQAVWAVVLTFAMDFVGVDFDVLPPSVIWATLAVVYLLPVGPGLTELAYITIFTAYLGRDNPVLAVAAAGVMIFRVFQWLIPIPIGYALLGWYQKRDRFSVF